MVVNSKDRLNGLSGSSMSGVGVFGRTADGFRYFASPAGSDLFEKEEQVYDPDKEEKELKYNQMVSSISHIDRKEETELRLGD